MKEVTLYTDGACSGNPGSGGYAAILLYKSAKKIISGSYRYTTNNRMEILAVIKGLEALKEKCQVSIYTDSKYISDAVTQNWISTWKRTGWKNSKKEDVKNQDLWLTLDKLLSQHFIKIFWVKGHAEDTLNNEADLIAVKASKKSEDFLIDSEFEKVSGINFG